jgi:hypothetical protein
VRTAEPCNLNHGVFLDKVEAVDLLQVARPRPVSVRSGDDAGMIQNILSQLGEGNAAIVGVTMT